MGTAERLAGVVDLLPQRLQGQDQAGYTQIGLTADTKGRIFRWENAPKAIVQGLEGNLVIPLLGEQGDRLKWSNNFTYMVENENKTTHQPLSVIPKYTINTMLDWQATDRLSMLLTGTFYGKQEPATTNINNDPRCTGAVMHRSRCRIVARTTSGA